MLLLGAFFALLTVGFWRRRARRPRRLVHPAGSAAEAAFRRHPAGRALTDGTESLSWADLNVVLNRAVNAVLGADLGPARRVAIMAPNRCST